MVAMPLLIYNTLKAIQYSQTIFDFIFLAHYVLHDHKTLWYINYILYRMKKTKITIEQYWTINSKLC